MEATTRDALVERLGAFPVLVEVGIGRRTDVAAALAEGSRVTATDIREREVPAGVEFVRDDVTDPDRGVYAGADAIYALNLPPELHGPSLALARDVDAALAFTTLGAEEPAIPARPEMIPGETLYWARRAQCRERNGVK